MAEAEPPTKKRRVNTTSFPFWPDPATPDYQFQFPPLADIEIDDEDLTEHQKEGKRWLATGFFHPNEDGRRWHGVHVLGQGSTGKVGLWVRANEHNTIEERIAARDVLVQPGDWVDPTMWRDQLPREIAIQRRLHERNGHDHHVHRYYAHRISMHQRMYRVFNEVCDFNHLLKSFNYYLSQWYFRHIIFRWYEAHSELRDAVATGDEEEVAHEKEEAWALYTQDPRHPDNTAGSDAEEDPNFEEWDQIPTLDVIVKGDLPEEPKNVIPERFIWTVFDQLVDAFAILATGGDAPRNDDVEWKEIVHNDVHLMNIFVKKADGAEGTPLPATEDEDSDDQDNHVLVQFDVDEYPSVVLADFDTSFFDLQSEYDVYADNPSHYMAGQTPGENPLAGGRYPPEIYWDFEGHEGGSFQKLDSKTNVWGDGQIIWVLIMNIPARGNVLEMPFLDNEGTQGRVLVNGTPYTAEDLEHVLSGNAPFESSNRYSRELKATVRRCLAYRLEDRPTLEELKKITRKHLDAKTNRIGPKCLKPDERVIIKVPPEDMQKFGLGMGFDAPAPAAGAKGKGKGKSKRKR